MKEFKEIIDKEDIPTYEIPLKTINIEPFPTDLKILRLKEGASFDQILFPLETSKEIEARIDLLPRAMIIDGREEQTMAAMSDQAPKTLCNNILEILDWNDIFYSILDYKNQRGLSNITVTKETLRRIIYDQKYTLLCSEDLLNPKSFESLENVKEIVVLILKKYFDRYYSRRRNDWEKKNIELISLKKMKVFLNHTNSK